MSMFCFQCEQTAGGTGCTKMGVCGKTPEASNLQDDITAAMITLARAVSGRGFRGPERSGRRQISRLSAVVWMRRR